MITEQSTTLSVARPESVGVSTDRLRRISEHLQTYIDGGHVTGAVTAAARHGQLVHLNAQGHTALDRRQPVQPDSIFRLASMTKVVTAVAVLMLFEQGKLRLTDPAADFIPELHGLYVAVDDAAQRTAPAEHDITIRELLSHTSGFTSSTVGPLAEAVQQARARVGTAGNVGDLVRHLARIPLSFQPGTAWAYSGLGGFDVLARIVEIVSGQAVDAFFRQHIFEPLRMPDTHFYLPDAAIPRLVSVYQKTDDGLVEMQRSFANPADRDGTYFSGAGGLAGTASDYVRFGQLLLNGGELDGERVLSPKTVALMRTNHIGSIPIRRPDMRGYRFGLGVQVVDDVSQARSMQTAGSFGWNGAFSTSFWVDPAEDMVHLVLTQTLVHASFTTRLWADVETLMAQAIIG